jgi:hypothetical protein
MATRTYITNTWAGPEDRIRCALLDLVVSRNFAQDPHISGSCFVLESPDQERKLWQINFNETNGLSVILSNYGLQDIGGIEGIRFLIGTMLTVTPRATQYMIYARVLAFDGNNDLVFYPENGFDWALKAGLSVSWLTVHEAEDITSWMDWE